MSGCLQAPVESDDRSALEDGGRAAGLVTELQPMSSEL